MPYRFRPLAGATLVKIFITLGVLSFSTYFARADEKQLVDCRVSKIFSDHEFEEGLSERHHPNVDLFQTLAGSKSKQVLQFGGFQDFDSSRGDRIEVSRTKELDIVYARYREEKWMVQITVSRVAGKAGFRAGEVKYLEDRKSSLKLIAKLDCK
ncbi:MAG: hypothetical protein KA715_07325 [Xanthomonadaceae bacterium]|nr:hypothetical protein [Xanthomonadaceae bacterium]